MKCGNFSSWFWFVSSQCFRDFEHYQKNFSCFCFALRNDYSGIFCPFPSHFFFSCHWTEFPTPFGHQLLIRWNAQSPSPMLSVTALHCRVFYLLYKSFLVWCNYTFFMSFGFAASTLMVMLKNYFPYQHDGGFSCYIFLLFCIALGLTFRTLICFVFFLLVLRLMGHHPLPSLFFRQVVSLYLGCSELLEMLLFQPP